MDLDALRQRLSAIDRQIVELTAERLSLAARIGAWKQSEGRPTRDFAREKQVLEQAATAAREVGVPPQLAESLMRLLIRSSLTHQERDRVRAEGRGGGQPALVIGGSGKMGHWFAEFLGSQGYEVTCADPAGPASSQSEGWVPSWEETPDHFAVTVVAASLQATPGLLEALASAGRGGLIFDIGSLKTPLMPALQRLVAAGSRVTSLHPMFGPDTELLSGRHVLFLDVGCAEATSQAQALFASTMAEQIVMPIEEHDRLIAYVLGLSHALNIAFFTALAESGEAAPRLAQLSSTTFEAQLEVAARVAAESPQLYFEIQSRNPHGLGPLAELQRAVERIASIVRTGDQRAFVELMERGRTYLARRR